MRDDLIRHNMALRLNMGAWWSFHAQKICVNKIIRYYNGWISHINSSVCTTVVHYFTGSNAGAHSKNVKPVTKSEFCGFYNHILILGIIFQFKQFYLCKCFFLAMMMKCCHLSQGCFTFLRKSARNTFQITEDNWVK